MAGRAMRGFGFAGALAVVVAAGLVPASAPAGEPSSRGPDAVAAPVAAPVAAGCRRARTGPVGTPIGDARQGSTVALARWPGGRTIAYVAHEDDAALHAIDVDGKIAPAVTPLDGAPSSVIVLADGRVVVAIRDRDRVQVLEPGDTPTEPMKSLCRVMVPAEPVGLAATPDDARVLVTSGWGHALSVLDAQTFGVRATADLPREPRAVVVDDAGTRAFVAHVVGATLSVVDLDKLGAATARSLDLAVMGKTGTMRKGCQGFALAKTTTAPPKDDRLIGELGVIRGDAPRAPAVPPPAPRLPPAPAPAPAPALAPAPPPAPSPPLMGRLFAPMVTVDPGDPSSTSGGYGAPDRGPAEAPVVSVIDAGAERTLTTTSAGGLSFRKEECVLPRAAAFAAGSSTLFVTCLGTDSVVELDARGVDPGRMVRRRFSVAKGPTGIALDEPRSRAIVWSQFDAQLTSIALATGTTAHKFALPARAGKGLTTEIARGRELFHAVDDARIAKDGRACASCHPDGREDALTWSTPEGPRQTIMLAGRVSGTEPFGWSGHNASLAQHVDETLVRLDGSGLSLDSDGDRRALLAYLGSMKGPSGAVAPSRATLAISGRALFESQEQGCASCHVAGDGTDGKQHVVAPSAQEGMLSVDTPALRYVGGTAPYFHDGRFATLEQLLVSPDHAMGKTVHLTVPQRRALVAYMETL